VTLRAGGSRTAGGSDVRVKWTQLLGRIGKPQSLVGKIVEQIDEGSVEQIDEGIQERASEAERRSAECERAKREFAEDDGSQPGRDPAK